MAARAPRRRPTHLCADDELTTVSCRTCRRLGLRKKYALYSGAPFTRGPLDFVYPVYPVGTPLVVHLSFRADDRIAFEEILVSHRVWRMQHAKMLYQLLQCEREGATHINIPEFEALKMFARGREVKYSFSRCRGRIHYIRVKSVGCCCVDSAGEETTLFVRSCRTHDCCCKRAESVPA